MVMNAVEKCMFCEHNKDNGALYECRLTPSRKCIMFKKISSKKIAKKLNDSIEEDYDESIDNLNNILSNSEDF